MHTLRVRYAHAMHTHHTRTAYVITRTAIGVHTQAFAHEYLLNGMDTLMYTVSIRRIRYSYATRT